MKPIIQILIIILLVSCSFSEKNGRKPARLEVDSIEAIYLKKELYGADSVRLTQSQISELVEKWNHSESKGIYKMGPEFWISISLKNDSVRKFRVNGDLIMENEDWAFSIDDSSLIRSFWTPIYSLPNPSD